LEDYNQKSKKYEQTTTIQLQTITPSLLEIIQQSAQLDVCKTR